MVDAAEKALALNVRIGVGSASASATGDGLTFVLVADVGVTTVGSFCFATAV